VQLLIVDDHAGIRELIAETAKPWMSDIQHFSSSEELLATPQLLDPDCVTVDFRMQAIDGIETLERLRVLYPKAHLIMITQFDQQRNRERAHRAGAHEFISKNDIAELSTSLMRLAQRRRTDASHE
jgi:two-component system, NarL family, response regulator EvgA